MTRITGMVIMVAVNAIAVGGIITASIHLTVHGALILLLIIAIIIPGVLITGTTQVTITLW